MERCLLFVSLLDAHVIVTLSDVELSEVLGATKLVNKFGNEGEGIAVLDRHLVQLSIVLNWL